MHCASTLDNHAQEEASDLHPGCAQPSASVRRLDVAARQLQQRRQLLHSAQEVLCCIQLGLGVCGGSSADDMFIQQRSQAKACIKVSRIVQLANRALPRRMLQQCCGALQQLIYNTV